MIDVREAIAMRREIDGLNVKMRAELDRVAECVDGLKTVLDDLRRLLQEAEANPLAPAELINRLRDAVRETECGYQIRLGRLDHARHVLGVAP